MVEQMTAMDRYMDKIVRILGDQERSKVKKHTLSEEREMDMEKLWYGHTKMK